MKRRCAGDTEYCKSTVGCGVQGPRVSNGQSATKYLLHGMSSETPSSKWIIAKQRIVSVACRRSKLVPVTGIRAPYHEPHVLHRCRVNSVLTIHASPPNNTCNVFQASVKSLCWKARPRGALARNAWDVPRETGPAEGKTSKERHMHGVEFDSHQVGGV